MRTALKGQTIGVQVGNALNGFIYKHFQDVAEIREYKTAADRTLDLADGRIDIAFDDMSYLNWALAKDENSDLGYTGHADFRSDLGCRRRLRLAAVRS